MVTRLSATAALIAVVLALALCRAPQPALDPTAVALPSATPPPTATPIPGERQEALVLRVVDGDTIVVDLDGARHSVRYIGIDTPETHHPDDGADYWGYEATEANKGFVSEGQTVVLQRDISETDMYGRLLRYVWVDDVLVNAELVRVGLARVLFYEPDVLYQGAIKAAEAEAQAARRGLYGPVPTPPAEQPLLHRGTAWTTLSAGDEIALRPDAARGEPVAALPPDLRVRVADAFWVPEEQRWWYWIGVRDFNGWVTDAYLTRDRPAAEDAGPPAPWNAYDRLTIVRETPMRARPDPAGEMLLSAPAGTEVQVKLISWQQDADTWWYYCESTAGEGWVPTDRLGR
ncbi:MAG: thermonuclease family protein [Anaerolineae bacterium]|nr:thermonuclease family protein [Anaerolineae bacterium]